MTSLDTFGERLVGRELRHTDNPLRYVPGQAWVEGRADPLAAIDSYEASAELTFVDDMSFAVLVTCVRVGGEWEAVTIVKADRNRQGRPCLASRSGFRLREEHHSLLNGLVEA